MKAWSPSWNLFSSSSFSSSSSGHSLLCMFLLCPSHSCISIIHVGNNQYGKYCLFLSQQYLSLFHYYQNIGFVWDGTMPSFFFKKNKHITVLSPMSLGGGQRWGKAGAFWSVRLHVLLGSLLGSHWKVLFSCYLCCLLPPLHLSSPFCLKQGWEAWGRAPVLNYEIGATCDFGEAKRQGEPEYCVCTLLESFMDRRSLFH